MVRLPLAIRRISLSIPSVSTLGPRVLRARWGSTDVEHVLVKVMQIMAGGGKDMSATADQLRPMGDRWWIKPAAREEELPRLLFPATNTSKEKPQRGESSPRRSGRDLRDGR